MERKATISGCVLFTQKTNINAYRVSPNDALVRDFPCFSYFPDDLTNGFPEFVEKTLNAPDLDFATEFERGSYKQDRGFVRQIGQQILNASEESPFVLLDNQRTAFAVCRAQVYSSLFSQGNAAAKKVIVVAGPPGSGKSVVAAKIWAALATEEAMPEGPIVFTSTSASQNSNWSHLFAGAAGNVAGRGVVKKATSYTPITTQHLGRLRIQHGCAFLDDAEKWRDHLRTVRALGVPFSAGSRDGEYLVSIVDEAHALINPEHVEGRGQFGFVIGLGPQAYHIMRVSQVTIFLLDEQQSFRARENTRIDDLRAWARELDAEFFTVSLEGSQFRCAGSKEYVDWIEAMFRGDDPEECRYLACQWKRSRQRSSTVSTATTESFGAKVAEDPVPYGRDLIRPIEIKGLEFQIFDTPIRMEGALRFKISDGHTARLLAPYARQWLTRDANHPHDLPTGMKDFQIPCPDDDGRVRIWERIWNFVPSNGSDYTKYIQAAPGSRMSADPLCEVGCPYAVRGFDWDYVGILWFSDLIVHQDGQWYADPHHVFETGISTLVSRARNERHKRGPHHQNLLEAVIQYYRILLTRPIRGVYLWFEDEQTRRFVESAL
jgi:hypothetical protein